MQYSYENVINPAGNPNDVINIQLVIYYKKLATQTILV